MHINSYLFKYNLCLEWRGFHNFKFDQVLRLNDCGCKLLLFWQRIALILNSLMS